MHTARARATHQHGEALQREREREAGGLRGREAAEVDVEPDTRQQQLGDGAARSKRLPSSARVRRSHMQPWLTVGWHPSLIGNSYTKTERGR
jgi:hypothetical protein